MAVAICLGNGKHCKRCSARSKATTDEDDSCELNDIVSTVIVLTLHMIQINARNSIPKIDMYLILHKP